MPKLLASGRTADVYEAGPGRVLRRYRVGIDAEPEADVMRYLAGLGYPVPIVYEASGTDMVMERVDGPTMVEAFVAGTLSLDEGMRILAELHKALHALPARHSSESVLHLDLHAENILMSARGPIVIDWNNSDEGPADLDVALSGLIMAEVAITPGHPLAEMVRPAVAAFLSYAGTPPWPMVERAVAMRNAIPALSAEEKARLGEAAALLT
ncbi:MAG TPA: phosphotransferase [Micromonosporaceae bacterium]|jgi:aminoglycoside phosphotransferase (APT) family kinase protein